MLSVTTLFASEIGVDDLDFEFSLALRSGQGLFEGFPGILKTLVQIAMIVVLDALSDTTAGELAGFSVGLQYRSGGGAVSVSGGDIEAGSQYDRHRECEGYPGHEV